MTQSDRRSDNVTHYAEGPMKNSALEQGTPTYVKTAKCIGGPAKRVPFPLDLLAKHNGKVGVVVSLARKQWCISDATRPAQFAHWQARELAPGFRARGLRAFNLC